MSAIGQKFHTECFTCFQCHRPIRSGLFHLENGEPYCDEGMMELRWSLLTGLVYYWCLVRWSNKLISDVILVYQFLSLVMVYSFLVCHYIS